MANHLGMTAVSISQTKGVYPQSNGSLAIVDIDASKGLRGVPTKRRKPCDDRYRCIERVCRSVGTLKSFAIFAIFDLKRQLKLPEMACDQVQTCLIFPLRWACFPFKIGRNAQWVHLFSMDFDDFLTIYLIF